MYLRNNHAGNEPAGNMYIGTTAYSQNLTLLNNGNVGIGTTSPGAKLEVAGAVKIAGNFAKLFFEDTAGSDLDAYIANNANGLFFGKTNSPSSSNDVLM